MRRWIEPVETVVTADLLAVAGGHPLVGQTLRRRGIVDARAFLDPAAYSPAASEELPDMQAAVERVEHALQQGETICVWGDFDVDGQTATALLVSTLRSLGGRVVYHIPVRETESHGVGLPALQRMLDEHKLQNTGLLLTCDTGISAHPAVEYANSRGVDVVITDHHDLPPGLQPGLPPALAAVNPKRLPGPHPLASLPGVGVAYKLGEALYKRAGRSAESEALLDLAALGIVADLAIQTGETRYLLQRGLQVLRSTRRAGLRMMMELAELEPTWLTEEHIGYVLAPRLNALGRLSDANPAVEFLTSADADRARLLALEMEALNARRKLLTEQVLQAALKQIEREPALLEQAGLVLAHPAWPGGVIGIVASQLVERFGKPTILFSAPPGGMARGSARSVEGLNITAAIAAQQDLLAGYGGHPMAAGLSLPTERIPDFRRRFSQAIEQMRQAVDIQDVPQIDGYLTLPDLTLDFVADLERLAPFGPGNPPLVLATRGLTVVDVSGVGRGGEHLLVTVEDEAGCSQRAIWWQGAGLPLPEGRFDLAYHLRASTYRGQRDVQVVWLDARPAPQAGVDLPTPPPEIQVVDSRNASDPLAELRRLQSERQLTVWAEAEAKREVGGSDRNELTPSTWLAIWTAPPGPGELRQALERVSPETVYLFAVDPRMDQAEAFLKRLAGLVKHAFEKEQVRLSLSRLGAATAQQTTVVRAGLEWLQASGHIRILESEGDLIRLAQGEGGKSASLPQAQADLTHLLDESAAYRAYFSRAEAPLLVERQSPGKSKP